MQICFAFTASTSCELHLMCEAIIHAYLNLTAISAISVVVWLMRSHKCLN